MASAPIRYFDRHDGTVKTERIFGERWLRWTYETVPGRLALALLARRAVFSRYYGWRMNRAYSAHQVLPFIGEYEVDAREFAKSPFEFRTFNQFFYRALKPEARPIAPGETVAVLPADGRHLAFQDVDRAEGFYVKGAKFSLDELLGGPTDPGGGGKETGGERKAAAGNVAGSRSAGTKSLGACFAGGSMLISRLCPTDYHRFHFPVAGVPGEARLINGWLYSVSPIALRWNIRYLVENRRMITLIESPVFGTVATIEVGATAVGSIRQSYVPGRAVQRGDEKGFFAFGGSCTITLFQRGRIRLDADLVERSAAGLEVYAKMGGRLGEAAGTGPA